MLQTCLIYLLKSSPWVRGWQQSSENGFREKTAWTVTRPCSQFIMLYHLGYLLVCPKDSVDNCNLFQTFLHSECNWDICTNYRHQNKNLNFPVAGVYCYLTARFRSSLTKNLFFNIKYCCKVNLVFQPFVFLFRSGKRNRNYLTQPLFEHLNSSLKSAFKKKMRSVSAMFFHNANVLLPIS